MMNMNMGPMPPGAVMGGPPVPQMPGGMPPQMVPGPVPGQMQQMPPGMQQMQSQEKFDNISKAKSLIGPLREALSSTLKNAAYALQNNSVIDIGNFKSNESLPPIRFDKNLEEFYSLSDQMELHLKTAIECVNLSNSSQRYLPLQVAIHRVEPSPAPDNTLTYTQFLSTVKSQVHYTKDLHNLILNAANTLSSNDS